MPYNLLTEPWIPVHRADGTLGWIAPHEITDAENPPIPFAAPRPDFNGVLIQFLIGLVQTALGPMDDDEWADLWETPPSPDDLRAAFSRYASAFDLDGGDARFLQDADELDGTPNPVSYLLVDTPTGSTLAQNKDHFVKNRDADVFSLPVAAMALLSMQTNAPSGGRGHRTSLRGGGPLTTVALGDTIWETVWLNVLPVSHFDSGDHTDDADVFPWLASTRTSEGGKATLPGDVHKLQAFWGMPRRIRLVFSDEGSVCALTGERVERCVTGYRTKAYGVNYEGTWEHPLTPHYTGPDGTPLPMHAQPGQLGYKDWLGFVYPQQAEKGGKKPAAAVAQFHERAGALGTYEDFEKLRGGHGPRLWTFGFDTDNMKVRAWQESTFPLYPLAADERPKLEAHAEQLVQSADYAVYRLKVAVKNAHYGSPEITAKGRVEWSFPFHIKNDSSILQRSEFAALETQFWSDTQEAFFDQLDRARQRLDDTDALSTLRGEWLRVLQRHALALFDRIAQTGTLQNADPAAVTLARRDLQRLPYDSLLQKMSPPKPAPASSTATS